MTKIFLCCILFFKVFKQRFLFVFNHLVRVHLFLIFSRIDGSKQYQSIVYL